MPEADLEQALRSFDQIATLVRDGSTRQIWRFEFNGQTYFLHFHRRPTGLARFWRGGAAFLQFMHLQAMQKASIPAPLPLAHLSGFRLAGEVGDAVIVSAIPDAVQLDRYLRDLRARSQQVPQRRSVAEQVVKIVHDLDTARFGHPRLGLDCFLISNGRVYLHAVGELRAGGLRLEHVSHLAHDTAPFATRTEILRAWDSLNPDSMPPRQNPLDRRLWNRFQSRSCKEGEQVGRLRIGDWSGYFTKTSRFAQPWSVASRSSPTHVECESIWPTLLAQIESDQLMPLKRDASGDVCAAEIVLGGKPVSIVVKRPRRTVWYRYILDLFRPARARRMWIKAWMLIARDIPCEWPILLMEKKTLGYTTDAVIAFERVPGQPLNRVDLDRLSPWNREILFRRAGRTLRAIERGGLVSYDSKSTNWIVFEDPARGPIPVMLDLDGIRPLNFFLQGWSIQRLLRAMKLHPQYTPADSLALCQGYAPYAPGFRQEATPAVPQ